MSAKTEGGESVASADEALSLTQRLSLNASSIFYSTKAMFSKYLHGSFQLPLGDSEDVVMLGERFPRKEAAGEAQGDAKPEGGREGEASSSSSSLPPAPPLPPTQAVQRRMHQCLWMTYRTNFAAIAGVNLTSDVGWGCTLRSTQMLAAEALIRLLPPPAPPSSGPDEPSQLPSAIPPDPPGLPPLLQCFLDLPQGPCPLSLHALLSYGRSFQVKPGQWYGPYSASLLLRAALQASGPTLRQALPPRGLRCLLASEPGGGAPCISRALVISEATAMSSTSPSPDEAAAPAPWTPLLLLVPLHLGLEGLNPLYVPQIKQALGWPQCVGVVGGRPGASFFLLGHQGDQALFLDPHESQEAARAPELEPALRESYRPRAIKAMRIADLDPSMAFGFVIRSEEDLDDFLGRVGGLGAEEGAESSQALLFTWSKEMPTPKHKRVQSGAPTEGNEEGEEGWEVL